MPFKDSRRRAALQASHARAAQRKQAREIALESSGSDSDESVSEPPSKSARDDDDTGASSRAVSTWCVMPQYLSLHILFIVLTLTADDMTVLHVGAMAEVCGLVNHWTHNGESASHIDFIRRIVRTMEC